MSTVLQKVKRADLRTDAVLATFERDLALILSKAQMRALMVLRSRFAIDERTHEILPTAANLRLIKLIPKTMRDALNFEGYDSVVASFLSKFDGGAPTFYDIINEVAKNYEVAPIDFTAGDKAFFAEMKNQTAFTLESALDRTLSLARQEALFAVGGTPFTQLSVQLAARLHASLGEASSIASTGIATFYRTITDRGYKKIEVELDKNGRTLEYMYYGPLDKLNREFCRKLETAARDGKTWTRAEIDKMDNGQLPDVFRSCGGYRCRHQWLAV